jgi:elongation factor G
MMRYGNTLRSITGGRGLYTMRFVRYERVPHHLQEAVIAEYKTEN